MRMGGKRGKKAKKNQNTTERRNPQETVRISRDVDKAFMNITGFVTSIAAAYKAFRHGDNFTR